MNYITVTELRTKSSKLIKSLLKGEDFSLIYRSKVVGRIKPIQNEEKLIVSDKIVPYLAKISPKKHKKPESRAKIYKQHLNEKYGKSVS